MGGFFWRGEGCGGIGNFLPAHFGVALNEGVIHLSQNKFRDRK